jgi:iron complex outermembrane receptor protein
MRLCVVIAAVCLCVVGLSVADDVHASIRKQTNIPAEGLGPALQTLAKERNFQIVYVSEEVNALQTQGAIGEFTPEEALNQLLKGTGLTYRFFGENAVSVIQVTAASAPPPSTSAMETQPSSRSNENSNEKEGKKSFWDNFRLAQVDQGKAASNSGVTGSQNQLSSRSNSDEEKLSEIVVTTQRREQSVDKVPISITALSQKSMDDFHIVNMEGLASVVPGLYVNPQPAVGQDGRVVAIRGIFSGSNAPTTQIYIDETPVAIRQMTGAALAGSPEPLIFDLNRVEVLRGPQGTLFGASAMGGAIRFITQQPSVTETSGFAKADAGYIEHGAPSYEVGAAFGAPVVQGIAGFRVSAWYQSTGGFIDQESPFTGQIVKSNINTSGKYVVQPAFTWTPSEDLGITASAFIQHKDSQNPNAYWENEVPATEGSKHIWGGISQPLSDDLRVGSLAVKYNFAGMTLQSDTSYLNREIQATNDVTQINDLIYGVADYQNPALANYRSPEVDIGSTNAWQQEFRLSSQDPSARVNWVTGLFYRRAKEALTQLISPDLSAITELCCGLTYQQFNNLYDNGAKDYVYQGQVLSAYQNFHTTDVSEAAFADVTVNFTKQLKADVGVRVEHTVVEDQDQIVAGPENGVTYSHVVLPDQVSTPITPHASLTYQYTDGSMVYTSVGKGYRPGGGNSYTAIGNPKCGASLQALGLTSVPATFTSDSLWSYEVGSKNRLLDNRLSIDGSVYWINWTNIQTNIQLPSCASNFTGNRGKAISKGFDLQIAAVVTDGLKLGVNVGYTDAYYPDAQYGAPNNGVAPLLNAAGDKVVPTVPWNAAAVMDYSRDTSSLWADSRSYLRVDYRWQSRTTNYDASTAGYNSSDVQDPRYSILNVRLGVTHNGLDLSAYITNVTNSDPVLGYFALGGGDPLHRAAALQPRTFGLTGWYRF